MNSEKRIFVKTFGYFEIFFNGKPLNFRRSKSKELVAFLIDHGFVKIPKKEIAAEIFEDKKYLDKTKVYISAILRDIDEKCESLGIQKIIRREKNFLSLDSMLFDCDFFYAESERNLLRDTEYMFQYSWAESSLRKQLVPLRAPEENRIAGSQKKKISANFADGFRIFMDGGEIHFSRRKSKELLACLIKISGSTLSRTGIAAVLFPERSYSRNLQKYMTMIISGLVSDLEKCGCGEILLVQHNCYSVDMSKIEVLFEQNKNGLL